MQAIVYWWNKRITNWNRVTDLLQQKQGKDITLILDDGSEVKIQFKSRTSKYDDLCIEHKHIYENGYEKPGWMEIESDADCLVYCMPSKVYLINYKDLHKAWQKNKNVWIRTFQKVPAKNTRGYTTISVAVPFSVLKKEGVDIDSFPINNLVQEKQIDKKKDRQEEVPIDWTDWSGFGDWPDEW